MSATNGGGFVFEGRGDREIVMAYRFVAPQERVFAAWTDCAGMANWYGPAGHELIVCESDLREGGAWRCVTRDEAGEETALRGVYLEISPPTRLVNTEIWEGMPEFVTTVTNSFAAEGGETRVTSVVLYPSAEAREGAMESGMEGGVRQTFERLAAYLATPAA